MKQSLLAMILAGSAFAATSGAAATCADRDHVTAKLKEQFGETQIANTVSHSNRVLEVFASPDAETWSIVVTIPERNLACLAATGKGQTRLNSMLKL